MAPVTIMIRNNGPYQVEGDFELVTADGVRVETTPGKPVKLCRCGASTKKPFCDGMHSKIGFQGAQAAQESFDARRGTDAVPGTEQPGAPKKDPSSGA
jgi:CDGSH-type Zn-finger protein